MFSVAELSADAEPVGCRGVCPAAALGLIVIVILLQMSGCGLRGPRGVVRVFLMSFCAAGHAR